MTRKRQALRYKTSTAGLARIKNLLEGYDNLALMTIKDTRDGIFELIVTEGMLDEVKDVMNAIREEEPLEECPDILPPPSF